MIYEGGRVLTPHELKLRQELKEAGELGAQLQESKDLLEADNRRLRTALEAMRQSRDDAMDVLKRVVTAMGSAIDELRGTGEGAKQP